MRYITIGLFLLFGLNAASQTSFGASASFNLATQQWTGEQRSYHRLTPMAGFQVGAFGNLHVNNQIGLHGELVYSLEGRRERLTSFNLPGHVKINYLRIPLLLQYFITQDLFAEAGPNVGVLLSGKEKWGNTSFNISRDVYRPVDFGLSIGAGYNLSEYIPGVTAGIRFYFGLANTVRENTVTGAGSGFKNRGLSFNVRYALFSE